MDKRLEEIEIILGNLRSQMFEKRMDIKDVCDENGIRCKIVPYGHRAEILEATTDWDRFEAGSTWGKPDEHELFRVKLTVPEDFFGQEVFFFMATGADDIWNTDNPQMLVYVNGIRRSGMDMNHNCVSIFSKEDWENGKDRAVDIGIYAYSNMAENGNYLDMWIAGLDMQHVSKSYERFCVVVRPFLGLCLEY